MRRILAACVLALVAVPAAAAAPLTVRTSFDETSVQFGDAIAAHVAIVVAPGVRAGSVRVLEDLTPLTPLSEQRTTRAGDVIEVSRTFVCVTAACVSEHGDAMPKLPPVQVVAQAGGRTVRVVRQWPVLHVRGRVSAADVAAAQPPLRASLVPPPATYAVAPARLGRLLDGAAIVLGLAAASLLVAQLRRRARRVRAPDVDELERAVRLAREAEARPVPDRRRAVGLLARVLSSRDTRLAATARDLAWAKPQPDPDALEALVGDVERSSPS